MYGPFVQYVLHTVEFQYLHLIPNIGIFVKILNMSKNTSVTLGNHFERIIEESIQSGRYSSASEVIRAGLRLVDEEEQKLRLLREAITAGESSGYVKKFNPVKHLESLNKRFVK